MIMARAYRKTANALRTYLRAAKLGMPAAMFNIASMLETGEGVARDKIEAINSICSRAIWASRRLYEGT